ncbi:DUF1361 domain-containing protein [Aureitalea sp. L0-47]|uniref:DUF1361 domain-containing protein n=1 Tax=Aureitalea sp. L0-47 TaxID=2816962 RepID=UPI002238D28D|nr:DUF1361 domain-containing protein [Aureitalea sp. L0-47]MCW5520715.1 DUF1361 domain-containing protein [Aureitalea sp. L0-47]
MNHLKTYFFNRFNTFSTLTLTSLGALMLLMLRVKLTHSFFLLFMVWNLFLAFIPFAISSFLKYRPARVSRWVLLCWGAAWLVFLPNAPYMLTDLIHLISDESIIWFDLVLILGFAINGLLFYYLSVRDMTEMIKQVGTPYWIRGILLFLPVLISIGVYIGRFQRWNSWDILTEPFGPIRDILSLIRYPIHHSLEWLFIIGFSLFLHMGNLAVKRLEFLKKLN